MLLGALAHQCLTIRSSGPLRRVALLSCGGQQRPLNSSVRPQNVLLSVLGASAHLVARARRRLVVSFGSRLACASAFWCVLGHRNSRAASGTQCASCAPYRCTTREVSAALSSSCGAGFFRRRPSPVALLARSVSSRYRSFQRQRVSCGLTSRSTRPSSRSRENPASLSGALTLTLGVRTITRWTFLHQIQCAQLSPSAWRSSLFAPWRKGGGSHRGQCCCSRVSGQLTYCTSTFPRGLWVQYLTNRCR